MSITGDSKPRISKIVATNKFSVVEYFTEEDLLNAGHKVNNLLGKKTGAVVCLKDALGSVSLYVAAGPDPEDPWYRMAGGVSDAETEFQKSMVVNGDARSYDKSIITYENTIPRTTYLGDGLYKFAPHNLIKTRRMSARWNTLNNAQVVAGGDGRDWGFGGVSSCWIPDQITYPGDTTAEFDIIVDTGSITVELQDLTGSYYARATFGPGTHTGQKLYFDTTKVVQLFVYANAPSSRFTMENIKVAAGKEVFDGGEDGKAYFEPRWYEDEFGGYFLLEDGHQNMIRPSCPRVEDFNAGTWQFQNGVSIANTTGPDGRDNALKVASPAMYSIWPTATGVSSPGDNYGILVSFTARSINQDSATLYVSKGMEYSGWLGSAILSKEWKRFTIEAFGPGTTNTDNTLGLAPSGYLIYEICDIQVQQINHLQRGAVQRTDYSPGILRSGVHSNAFMEISTERFKLGNIRETLLSKDKEDPNYPALFPGALATMVSKHAAFPLLATTDVIGNDGGMNPNGIIKGVQEMGGSNLYGNQPQTQVYFMNYYVIPTTTKLERTTPEVVAFTYDLSGPSVGRPDRLTLGLFKITEKEGVRWDEMTYPTNEWSYNMNLLPFNGTVSLPREAYYRYGSVIKLYNLAIFPKFSDMETLEDYAKTLIPVE